MTNIDKSVIENEQKRVKYTKWIFLSLLITALAYIFTTSVERPGNSFEDLRVTTSESTPSIEQPFFIGFMVLIGVQVIMIIIVQIIYYEDLPHDFDLNDYQS